MGWLCCIVTEADQVVKFALIAEQQSTTRNMKALNIGLQVLVTSKSHNAGQQDNGLAKELTAATPN
jgi:hypothetical protein